MKAMIGPTRRLQEAKGRHKNANASVDAPGDYPIIQASLQKIGVNMQVPCWSLLSNPWISPLRCKNGHESEEHVNEDET